MVPAGATVPVEGVTVMDCSVGLTKKPRQPAAKPSTDKAAKVAKRRSFRLKKDMVKSSGKRTFLCNVRWKWLPRIVAEKVLVRRIECTSVCTKVCGASQLRLPDQTFRFGDATGTRDPINLLPSRSANLLLDAVGGNKAEFEIVNFDEKAL